MTRETIYAALFAYFSGLTDGGSALFKKATRKLTVWEGVEAEDQPALLMLQKSELCQRQRGLPSKWTLRIDLYLYVHTGAMNDPDLIPSQIFNPLMDAIEASVAIDDLSNNTCTLGGLVYHTFIDGDVEVFEGNLGDQAVVIVPITVLVPS